MVTIENLLFLGLFSFLILALFDRPIESQQLLAELLKILISGYLGYLIRRIEE